MKKKKIFYKKKYNSVLVAILISTIITTIGGMIDSIIGGSAIGEDAVSAIGIVAPFYAIIEFVALMFSEGGAVLYSQKMGAFKENEAKKVAGQSLVINLITGLILACVLFAIKDIYLGFFDLSSEIYILAGQYYDWFIPMGFFFPVYYLLYYLVLDDGDEKTSTASDILYIITNTIISLLLVDKMGVSGLGCGTCIANFLGILFLLTHFLKKSNGVKFKIAFNGKDLLKALKIGFPLTTAYLYAGLLDVIMNKFLISQFGDIYLPAYSVCNLVLNLLTVAGCGLSAGAPQICVYTGENNDVGMKRIMKTARTTTLIFGIIFTAFYIFGSNVIPNVYGIVTPEVYEASVRTCILIGITAIPAALTFMYVCYFPYVNKEWIATIGGTLYSFICPLLFGILGGLIVGYDGIAGGIALAPVVTLLSFHFNVKVICHNKNDMLCLPKPEGEILQYDLILNEKNIIELRDKVAQDLINRNIKLSLVKKVELMIEEVYMLIKETNEDKQKEKNKDNKFLRLINKITKKEFAFKREILSECNVIVCDKYIKLMTRDNGVLFDITDANNEIKSLRSYIVANFMENVDDKSYLITTSFNRNSFTFERDN